MKLNGVKLLVHRNPGEKVLPIELVVIFRSRFEVKPNPSKRQRKRTLSGESVETLTRANNIEATSNELEESPKKKKKKSKQKKESIVEENGNNDEGW